MLTMYGFYIHFHKMKCCKLFFNFQATAVYDAEHAESIQKGQHIQPSANGLFLTPGNLHQLLYADDFFTTDTSV